MNAMVQEKPACALDLESRTVGEGGGEMRGVGGPLLCIGDLLADVGEADDGNPSSSPPFPLVESRSELADPSQLDRLFQENCDRLNKALAVTEPSDHSWTVLTLKLCSALETADKLLQTANTNAETLNKNIGVLENIIKRGDAAVESAKAVQSSQYKLLKVS